MIYLNVTPELQKYTSLFYKRTTHALLYAHAQINELADFGK